MEHSKDVICYYHANCLDGFTSAWFIHHMHMVREGENEKGVELIPVNYGDEAPALPVDSIIYIVDFTFPDKEFMKMLIDNNQSVVHIDHHEGAQSTIEELEAYDQEGKYACVFDTSRSGAGLTWDTFCPGKERPHLINFVEDRDLWRFKYSETRFFTEGLSQQPFTIEAWDWAQTKDAADWLIKEGEKHHRERIERCLSQIEKTGRSGILEHDGVEWKTHYSQLLEPTDSSEQTNIIINNTDHKVAIAIYALDDRRWKVRVTTAEDGPNAYDIAKAFHPEGGGHRRVGGFVIDKDELTI